MERVLLPCSDFKTHEKNLAAYYVTIIINETIVDAAQRSPSNSVMDPNDYGINFLYCTVDLKVWSLFYKRRKPDRTSTAHKSFTLLSLLSRAFICPQSNFCLLCIRMVQLFLMLAAMAFMLLSVADAAPMASFQVPASPAPPRSSGTDLISAGSDDDDKMAAKKPCCILYCTTGCRCCSVDDIVADGRRELAL